MKKYGKRMQFDPMTGEPIDPEAKFDPMTGKPLYSNNGKQGKTGKKIAIIGGVTAVAAIGLTVFGAVKSGIFFSDSTKVLMATTNTVRDMEHFSDIVKSAEILSSGKYTTTIHAGLEDTEAEAQILRGKAKVQIAAQVEFPDSDQVSALAELNEREARLEVPVLSDKMFAYNYREEKGGYLADEGVLENVDEVLQLAGQALGEEKDVQKMWKELVSSLSEEWKEVEVVKRNPEEYEVDGKFRKCKGYTVSLTEENMEDLLSVTEDIVTDYYDSKLCEEMLSNIFSELEYIIEDMPDVDVTCYVYKNKLAAVGLEVDRNEMEIQFLGGKTRFQNMEISVEDETVIEVEGETEGSAEVTTVYIEGEEALEMEYDRKSGEYKIEVPQADMEMSGVFLADKKKMELSAETVEVYGNRLDVDCLLSIRKGAEFREFEGDVFDVGEASKSELEDLGEELMEQIEEDENLEDFLYELDYYL